MDAPRETFHMTPEEFRRAGYATVDWVADYLAGVADLPVLSQVRPGEIRAALPPSPPEHGEPYADLLADLTNVVLPGVTHWQSPGFHAFFPCNGSGPSILGDLVSTGLGVQGMLWATSPAATELETHVLDWLAELLGLPGHFRGNGVIQDSASSATLCALLAARQRASRDGVPYERLTGYTSSHAHSSVEKAWRIAGLPPAHLRVVEVDAAYALRPGALRALVEADVDAGLTPAYVVATAGTTSSLAFDPVAAVREAAPGAWLHVDAAMAGSAAVCEELRWVHDGLEHADSYCVNPHKWLFTSFDCDAFYVRDRAALVDALSVTPEYLRNAATESGAVIDYRDWQIPLGRRFRALKLWFVIRHYGAEGLRHHVREHVSLAHELAGWIGREPRLLLVADARLNLVCFRDVRGDGATQALLDRLNATGEVYLTHTRLDGHLTIRACIGATQTRREHVLRLRDLIAENVR